MSQLNPYFIENMKEGVSYTGPPINRKKIFNLQFLSHCSNDIHKTVVAYTVSEILMKNQHLLILITHGTEGTLHVHPTLYAPYAGHMVICMVNN